MAEKNPKLKFDDYTRRLMIPDADKREAFQKHFNLATTTMYRILSTQPFNAALYSKKRAEQDNLRYLAWKDYGALFENISFTRN